MNIVVARNEDIVSTEGIEAVCCSTDGIRLSDMITHQETSFLAKR